MRPLIASFLVAIAVLACSETLSPSVYTGTYPLLRVNGAAVPAGAAAAPDGCTEAFGQGTLTLGDGVFSLTFNSGYGCPGTNATSYSVTIGGSITGRSSPLTARAIDPMAQTPSVMEMSLSVSGSNASLTLPPGAMQLASATTLEFGPRQ